jgi:hypothetical protein
MPKLVSAVDQAGIAAQADDEDSFIRVAFDWLRSRPALFTPEFESPEELIMLMMTGALGRPHPLTVKQLARQIPGASVRAAKRILGRA